MSSCFCGIRFFQLKNLSVLLIFFLFTSGIQAQDYSFELVKNDTILTEKQLGKKADFKTIHGSLAVRKREYETILTQLRQQGHLNARFDSIVEKDSLTQIAYLSTGRVYQWGILEQGNVDDYIIRKVDFNQKIYDQRPIYYKRVGRLMERILRYCENNGYPFASVKMDSIQIKDNIISGKLNLEKNKLYEIDSVIIKGDAKIKEAYIYNYLDIKPGDVYNEALIKKIKIRLKELPFVTETKPAQAAFFEDKVKLYLYLDNKKASQFDGILGVLPDNATGKVVITGDLKLKLQNSFGRGELIDVNWRKLQPRTQDLKAQFVYPFLFSTPFGIDLKLELYKRDTLFLNLNRVAGIQFLLSGNNYIKAFYEARSTNVLSTTQYQNITSIQNLPYIDVSTNLYGLGYNLEKLDYRFNPRKGFAMNATGRAGNKRIRRNGGIPAEAYEGTQLRTLQASGELLFDYFIPIPRRSTINLGVNSAYLWNEQLFDNELYRIGGLRTLRGFDEESINANMYGIFTAEYRYLLEQNSYLSAFYDWAYYEKITAADRVIDRPFGFGAGINFETPIGIFSLSYAVGKQFDNPIQFRAAKIHFGFVNRFWLKRIYVFSVNKSNKLLISILNYTFYIHSFCILN